MDSSKDGKLGFHLAMCWVTQWDLQWEGRLEKSWGWLLVQKWAECWGLWRGLQLVLH